MSRRLTILACLAVCLVYGCGRVQPVAVERADLRFPSSETFLVESTFDAGLPAPDRDGAVEMEDSALELEHGRRRVGPAVFWAQTVDELGRAAPLPPPLFARAYALVEIGIHDALVLSAKRRHGHLNERAVAAGVADEVMSYLFPTRATDIRDRVAAQVGRGKGKSVRRGLEFGRAVGRRFVQYGRSDGSDRPFPGPIPTDPGIWTGTNPVLPMAGTWKCWILTGGDQFQPRAPHPYGSPEDLAEVAEVLEVAQHRTPEQIAAVHKWGDISPPVIWNRMLEERLLGRDWSAAKEARAYAYVNAALFDAFVSCWQCKYKFWTARPFHRIPGLVTVIPTPNFPSYSSGHSTISAAAAAVMGNLFPRERRFFAAEAEEAAMSRLWGGIHFRQDNDQGSLVGQKIGRAMVARMNREHRRDSDLAVR